MANSTLAALVTRLKLGIQPDEKEKRERKLFRNKPKWTATHIRILQLCPNVEHADIRGSML